MTLPPEPLSARLARALRGRIRRPARGAAARRPRPGRHRPRRRRRATPSAARCRRLARAAASIPYDGPWTARRAGWLTLVGGCSVIADGLARDQRPARRRTAADLPRRHRPASRVLFVRDLLLLTIGIWAVVATLPSTSRVARAAAYVGALAGLLWALGPWMMLFGPRSASAFAILAIEIARIGPLAWLGRGRPGRPGSVVAIGVVAIADRHSVRPARPCRSRRPTSSS